MIDQRGRLREEPFSYMTTKDSKVRIFYENREIMILSVKDSLKLLRRIENRDAFEVQLALAKVTGNFKHGNERK